MGKEGGAALGGLPEKRVDVTHFPQNLQFCFGKTYILEKRKIQASLIVNKLTIRIIHHSNTPQRAGTVVDLNDESKFVT